MPCRESGEDRWVLKTMEDSWTCDENEEMRCIEAAPRRMRMASRGEMLLKRERRDRYIVKRRGRGDGRGHG